LWLFTFVSFLVSTIIFLHVVSLFSILQHFSRACSFHYAAFLFLFEPNHFKVAFNSLGGASFRLATSLLLQAGGQNACSNMLLLENSDSVSFWQSLYPCQTFFVGSENMLHCNILAKNFLPGQKMLCIGVSVTFGVLLSLFSSLREWVFFCSCMLLKWSSLPSCGRQPKLLWLSQGSLMTLHTKTYQDILRFGPPWQSESLTAWTFHPRFTVDIT
jgi:hypothetical protein